MTGLVSVSIETSRLPALVAAAGERAQTRFWEFFVSNIRNPHTRRAYGRSIAEFLAWCEQHGLASIIDVEPLHVGSLPKGSWGTTGAHRRKLHSTVRCQGELTRWSVCCGVTAAAGRDAFGCHAF